MSSIGPIDWALAVAAAAGMLLFAARRRKGPWLVPPCLVAFVLASLPLGGGPSLAGYLRGMGGGLSVPSLVVVGASLLALVGGADAMTKKELLPLTLASLAAAVFLYPMALGLTRFDPYILGYRTHAVWLLLGLALVALASALGGRFLLLVSVLGAVAAWSFALGESANLWDYLLDPWLSLFAAGWLGKHLRSSVHSPNLRKPADDRAGK